LTTPPLSRGRSSPPSITLALEDQLVSWETGLLGELRRVDAPTLDPTDTAGVVGYVAITAGDGSQSARDVGSFSFDPTLARVRAIGEAVDRYAWASAHRVGTTRVATFRELGARAALDPSTLALPTEEERERWSLVRYTEDLPITWADGWRIRGGVIEPALIPVQLYVDPAQVPPPRFVIRWPTNTAAGNTLVEAVGAVLREVIESDALAMCWLRKRPVAHVDLASIADPDVQRWAEHHRGRGREPMILSLPSDFGVPTIAAAILDPAGPVYFVWGFATSLDHESAIRKAVEEVEGMRYAIPDEFTVPQTATEHRFYYWQRPDRLEALAFLTAPDRVIPAGALASSRATGTPYDNLMQLAAAIERANLEVFFVDITPPELNDRMPLHAATAIVPGTVSLGSSERPWHLGAPRLAGHGPLNTLACPIW
jgi:thiazole/oxazole-forming peptide maturase SagD family component